MRAASRLDPVGAFDEATGSLDQVPLETAIGCCDAYSIPGYERLPQHSISPRLAQAMRLARRRKSSRKQRADPSAPASPLPATLPAQTVERDDTRITRIG